MSLLYLVKESARAIRRGGDGQSRTHCAPSPTRCDALCIRRTATTAPGTHTQNLPLIGAAITICDCPGQDAPQRRTKRAFQQRVDQLEEEACARACRAHLCPCAATIALCTEPPPPPTPTPAYDARSWPMRRSSSLWHTLGLPSWKQPERSRRSRRQSKWHPTRWNDARANVSPHPSHTRDRRSPHLQSCPRRSRPHFRSH